MVEPEKAMLKELDTKIANAIVENNELADKTYKVEECKIILLEKITLLESFISSQGTVVSPSTNSPGSS